MKDVSLHCKITVVLLIIFPLSFMVAFLISAVVLQVPLHEMAVFACFWSIIPAVVQAVILIFIVLELYKDDAKLRDINQWWSTFGLISSMCFHFYAVYLSATVWTSNDRKCFDNKRQCALLTLLFEFVGVSWIAMMGLAYHSCFKRVFHTRGIHGHHHHRNHHDDHERIQLERDEMGTDLGT